MSKSVAPPRTASSLKKLLYKVEGFEGPESCALYLSVSEKSSVEATARLSFRGDSGPGSSVLDPMALVVGSQASEKRSAAVGEAKIPVERLDEQAIRYVHYRVYDESGEVVSKTSFNEDDTSLGRMETFSIPPPHTVASLKSCINKAEGMSGHDLQVFEDEEGEVTMEEDNTIALLADTYPGIVEGEPIVIVYESQKKTSVSDLQTFAKRIKSTYSSTWVSDDPNWHSLKPGVIFRTDGILIKKLYKKTGVESEGYMAIDSEGKRACISKSWAQFC